MISIEQRHANELHLVNSDLYIARRAAAARGIGAFRLTRAWKSLAPNASRFGDFTPGEMIAITQAFNRLTPIVKVAA